MKSLGGEWEGSITGTNTGRCLLKFHDAEGDIRGTVWIRDNKMGESVYAARGIRDDSKFQISLIPKSTQPGVVLAPGTVEGTLVGSDQLRGAWETDLGSAGTVTANRISTVELNERISSKMVNVRSKPSSMTPLWVISLFLSFAEIVAGLAATQMSGGIQVALTIFVIAFPVLVASGFFAILWFKPYVFYPPTEYGSATDVAEYVSALGGKPTSEARENQRWLMGTTNNAIDQDEVSEGANVEPPIPPTNRLESDIIKYFAFRQMRLSDVSNEDTRSVFDLGRDYRFLLFDGPDEISFFGLFVAEPPEEIVARVRFLLGNIQTATLRVKEVDDDNSRIRGLSLIARLRVEVLVPDDANKQALEGKVTEFRPVDSETPVHFVKAKDITRQVEEEYRKMGFERNG